MTLGISGLTNRAVMKLIFNILCDTAHICMSMFLIVCYIFLDLKQISYFSGLGFLLSDRKNLTLSSPFAENTTKTYHLCQFYNIYINYNQQLFKYISGKFGDSTSSHSED